MKIGVLLKQVPDTETKIKLKSGNKGFEEEGIKWIINPYDEFAVEEALKLKEKTGGGEVVIVTAGHPRAVESMRQALAMGADRGIRIDTTGAHLDIYSTSSLLASVVTEEKFDIVFAGKQAVDDDCAAVVQFVAEIAGIPHVSPIETFNINSDNKHAVVQRPLAGGTKEMVEIELPCVLGCEKGLNTPRYATLPGIMKAKSKPIAEKKASDILKGNGVNVSMLGWELPPERTGGKKVDGEPEIVSEQLIKFLKEEAKVL